MHCNALGAILPALSRERVAPIPGIVPLLEGRDLGTTLLKSALSPLRRAFPLGSHRTPGNFLPVADINFVRPMREIKSAEILDVLLQPADLFFRREFAGMIAAGGTPPHNPGSACSQQFVRPVRRRRVARTG